MPFGLSKLTTLFPALRVETNGKNSFNIFGEIHVKASWGGFTVNEYFSIRILAEDFPALPPICFELSEKNTTYHVNPQKNLCLGSPRVLHEEIVAQPDIVFFINKFIIPFFFSFRYYEKYGESPFGELAHGGNGIFPRYREILRVSDTAICIFLTYGTKFLYRGHHFCPCGSGLALRKCHGPRLRALFENYHPALLHIDLENCVHALKSRGSGQQIILLEQRYIKAKNVLNTLIRGRGRG